MLALRCLDTDSTQLNLPSLRSISMTPKLSVIIPCYNCAETLREAIATCYEQDFAENEFEIVLAEDCSTDTTRSVIGSLAHEHTNIHVVFHERNQGGDNCDHACWFHLCALL